MYFECLIIKSENSFVSIFEFLVNEIVECLITHTIYYELVSVLNLMITFSALRSLSYLRCQETFLLGLIGH